MQELHNSHVHQSIACIYGWLFYGPLLSPADVPFISSMQFVSTEESTDIIDKTGVFAYFFNACCKL